MGGCISKVQNGAEQKRAFTITEAAEYACVSRATLMNWIVTGLLPYEELPGRGDGSHRFRLIRKSDLNAFLERYYHASKDKGKSENPRQEIVLLERTT